MKKGGVRGEGLYRINIKMHNLAKTNYTILFGFLITNRFCQIYNWQKRFILGSDSSYSLRSYHRQNDL